MRVSSAWHAVCACRPAACFLMLLPALLPAAGAPLCVFLCPPPPMQVTTTSAKAGGFEARFYHKIYAEEFGNVRGHFGPINTVAFSPDGRSFTTGGEEAASSSP